jgi:hypothetical protein
VKNLDLPGTANGRRLTLAVRLDGAIANRMETTCER